MFRIITDLFSRLFKIISKCLFVCNLNTIFCIITHILSGVFKIISQGLLALLRKKQRSYLLYWNITACF